MTSQTADIAVRLLKLSTSHVINKVRFSCVFCGFTQGEYRKEERGFLHLGVCKDCAPNTLVYIEKATRDYPQAMDNLAKHFSEVLK